MVNACNWCFKNLLNNGQKKPYCHSCANKCIRECIRCHRPFDSLKYFTDNAERCNSCQKKYIKESNKTLVPVLPSPSHSTITLSSSSCSSESESTKNIISSSESEGDTKINSVKDKRITAKVSKKTAKPLKPILKKTQKNKLVKKVTLKNKKAQPVKKTCVTKQASVQLLNNPLLTSRKVAYLPIFSKLPGNDSSSDNMLSLLNDPTVKIAYVPLFLN